ncbi:MAG: hypothetical protein HWD92_09165 [Flavobacteriia bacterium]|nr:hypothetical protein [Flavobacteriia bacterium]
MNSLDDWRYNVSSIIEELKAAPNSHYRAYQRQIDEHGSYKCKIGDETIQFYTPELALIMFKSGLSSLNLTTTKVDRLPQDEFFRIYHSAFNEGKQYFEENYNLKPSALYGENAHLFVKDIHYNYFHAVHTGIHEGWSFVKNFFPFILTEIEIAKYGYYAGIVCSVDTLVQRHKLLFKEFDRCDIMEEQAMLSNEPILSRLIDFITYLHSSIDSFNHFRPELERLEELQLARRRLRPNDNYKDKLAYDKIQKELDEKFEVVSENVASKIKNRAIELDLCSDEPSPANYWGALEHELREFKREFRGEHDVEVILEAMRKYLYFRNNTHPTFMSLQIFLSDLDEALHEFFKFFSDDADQEFAKLRGVSIVINSERTPTTESTNKVKRKRPAKSIQFIDSETRERVYQGLKGFFEGSEDILMDALKGEAIKERLYFPSKQNQLVEVFKRLKYNGMILSTSREIRDWLCDNFSYKHTHGAVKEVRPLNAGSVDAILIKGRNEPSKSKRICSYDWLPWKSSSDRNNS